MNTAPMLHNARNVFFTDKAPGNYYQNGSERSLEGMLLLYVDLVNAIHIQMGNGVSVRYDNITNKY